MSAPLKDLEVQVDHLITHIQRLKSENFSLRAHLTRNNKECSELQRKNEKAMGTIKQLISRLKEELG
jgi:uncharacterized protein (TIGR02449 family)